MLDFYGSLALTVWLTQLQIVEECCSRLKLHCAFMQGSLSGTPDTFDGGYYAEVISVNGYKGEQNLTEPTGQHILEHISEAVVTHSRCCSSVNSTQ